MDMVAGMKSSKSEKTDNNEFRQILIEYQNRVYNQSYRMLGNREDAEEATQDIFLKIYQSFDTFRGESKLSTWIYRITSNVCISRLRKKQLDLKSLDAPFEAEEKSLADIIPDDSPNPEEYLENEETAKMVRNQVKSLKAEWAMAITLYHFEDLSYQEIAEIMDIPTATVATYILRGRNQLARQIMKVL